MEDKNMELKKEEKVEKEIKKDGGFIDPVKLTGELRMVLKDKYGNLKEDRTIKNTITSVGKAELAGLLLIDISGTAFDYIAIGTGTPGATALGVECTTNGGARRGGADVVGTRVQTTTANDTAQLVTTFTFTGALAITEEGIFNAATSGTMLASQSFSVLNVADGDTLAITHKVKVA
jgi:hypothetical protein